MSPDDLTKQVRADLLADRGEALELPGLWGKHTDRRERRWIDRLARAERRRPQLESEISQDTQGMAFWSQLTPTDQREILSTVDYLRFWPAKWQIKRTAAAVQRGPEHRSRRRY